MEKVKYGFKKEIKEDYKKYCENNENLLCHTK